MTTQRKKYAMAAMYGEDTCTHSGATKTAAKIRNYWFERGYVVKTVVIPCGYHAAAREVVYGVRSNLVNGWPQ